MVYIQMILGVMVLGSFGGWECGNPVDFTYVVNRLTVDKIIELKTEMYDVRLQSEKEKILQSIKSGKMRPDEGASARGDSKGAIDINNATDEMLADLERRALNGEEITLA